jgi:hypothetical protein
MAGHVDRDDVGAAWPGSRSGDDVEVGVAGN